MSKFINLTALLFTVGGGLLVLTSCTPIKSASDFRNKMAKKIAAPMGMTTVWNTSTPLTLGHIYERRKSTNPKNKKVKHTLALASERFAKSAGSKYLMKSPVIESWSHNVDHQWNIKPQLEYAGIGVNSSFANTKQIRFSASGDQRYSISNRGLFQRQVLNKADYDSSFLSIAEDVHSDTERLEREQLPLTEAAYWIVTDYVTVKDLSVEFTAKPSTSFNVAIDDKTKLVKFLKLASSDLMISGSGGVTVDQTVKSDIKSIKPMGLVAWCSPITAIKKGGRYEFTVHINEHLDDANTFE